MQEQYRLDYDKLLGVLLPLMEANVKKYPGLAPVGAMMDVAGKCSIAGAYDGKEDGLCADLEALLIGAFRQWVSKGTLRACALGYGCEITLPKTKERSEALAIKFEHRDGLTMVFYKPFQRNELGVNFIAEPFSMAGKPEVFSK